MTAKRSSLDEANDQWATNFANEERRRNIAIGLAAFLVFAFIVAAIIAQFSAGAAIAW